MDKGLTRIVFAALGLFVLGAAAPPPDAPNTVPDFSGPWQRTGGSFDFSQPAPGIGPGPLVNISGDRLVPIADEKSPLLLPWAAAEVKKHGDILRAGRLAPDAHTSCQPMGVPYVLQVRENMQLLQTQAWITMIYQNDNQRRSVRMNVPHSANPKPTWMGESVGHYEGDTLVIDTIAIARHDVSAIDRFGTPHTDKLHVVERYRVAGDRKTMNVDFMVEDPGTFTTPWFASVVYVAGDPQTGEHICAENIRDFGAGGGVITIPVPTAAKPDF